MSEHISFRNRAFVGGVVAVVTIMIFGNLTGTFKESNWFVKALALVGVVIAAWSYLSMQWYSARSMWSHIQNNNRSILWLPLPWIAYFAPVLLVPVVHWLMDKTGRRCPSCNAVNSLQVINVDHLGSEQGYATINRTDRHYNKDGHHTGVTHRREQVVVTHTTERLGLRCQSCGDQFEQIQTRTS